MLGLRNSIPYILHVRGQFPISGLAQQREWMICSFVVRQLQIRIEVMQIDIGKRKNNELLQQYQFVIMRRNIVKARLLSFSNGQHLPYRYRKIDRSMDAKESKQAEIMKKNRIPRVYNYSSPKNTGPENFIRDRTATDGVMVAQMLSPTPEGPSCARRIK